MEIFLIQAFRVEEKYDEPRLLCFSIHPPEDGGEDEEPGDSIAVVNN